MRATAPAAVLAAVIGLASCTSTPQHQAESIEWGHCLRVAPRSLAELPPERLNQLEFGCGTVDVAVDPTDGNLGRIAVQLIRVRRATSAAGSATATAGDKIGPLLLIAGGPGQSGVEYAGVAAGYLSDQILDHFDVVAFDPRGVGRSAPIRCAHTDVPTLGMPDLLSAAGYARAAAVAAHTSSACLSALGARAGAFSTTATAADIDAIRRALGERALTYVGWSYGAKLGAEYARRFPGSVRAAVLDAPTDPTASWTAAAEYQLRGFESALDEFAAWCGTDHSCRSLGYVRSSLAALVAQAERVPIPSTRPGDDEPADGADVIDAVATSMYDSARWPDLATGIVEASEGDSRLLRSLFDAGRTDTEDTNEDDANLVINCNDSAPGPEPAQIMTAAARFAEQFPIFGRWGSYRLLACASWSAPRHPLAVPVADTEHPLVVVGTVHDPATPYAGAASMARVLGNATLLTWEGQGHTAYGRDACIARLVDSYLVSLSVPAPGTRCPA